MFQLTDDEFENWKSQIVTSNCKILISQFVISIDDSLRSQIVTLKHFMIANYDQQE